MAAASAGCVIVVSHVQEMAASWSSPRSGGPPSLYSGSSSPISAANTVAVNKSTRRALRDRRIFMGFGGAASTLTIAHRKLLNLNRAH
ncbi:unnamed protein product [Lampetra planeri]